MIELRKSYLLIHQGLTVYQIMLAGFMVLLIAALIFLLIKKLNTLRREASYTDDETPSVPAATSVSSGPAAPGYDSLIDTPALAAQPVESETKIVVMAERRPAPVLRQVNYDGGLLLSESTSEVNAILNSLGDIIFEYDENKVCINLWYNKTRTDMVDLEMFRGKTVTEALGNQHAKIINDALDFVAANGVATTIEFISFFGSGRWFQSHISPVFDADGNFTGRTTAAVKDISEQKKYAIQLKEKQQQLVDAQKIAGLGNWWYDVNLKETGWSDNLYALLEITGLPANTSHFEYYISCVQAEDRRAVYQFFNDLAGLQHQHNEHRILTANGHLRYFRIVRGQPVKDNQGNICRVTGVIQDVTESRVIARTIKKSKAELLEAQTAAKIGNWKWYLGKKNIVWSDEVYHIYEVAPDRPTHAISHFKLLLKYVHPEDKAIVTGFLRNAFNLRRTLYEYRIITPGGNIKYVSINIARIKKDDNGQPHKVIGTLQDITERKKAELHIQKTEDTYKLVLETIKLAAVSLDKNGNIVFCNTYLANLLGRSQQSLIGLNWYKNFIPEDIRDGFSGWYAANKIPSDYINPLICNGGELRTISWQNTIVYDEHGRIKQTTSIGEDVTDQQKDRLQLISAKEEAERSSQFKSDFLSTMSHEIRTPMNAVIGTTNLLLEENPRPDQLSYLNNLKFSGENLLGIIDDILDYNKIEAGKLELSKTPVNIHQLAANIKQSFQARAMEKKLDIVVEIDEKIPKNLVADSIRLSQILNNLLSNAIKFTHKGTVTILVREDTRTGQRIKLNFTVADTGIGIEQQSLQRIFEPFVQESQRRDYGGSGLGLAIIRKLVELHGSTITVSSTLGKGTQFNFTLELEYTAEPVPKPQLNAVQKMQEADLAGMRVLVVDDNKMNILIAGRFLNKWNITIHEANNGLVATEMVSNNNYDLIIMDLQMPVMDGFEATRKIKISHPGLPVIALTADAMPETFDKARNSGMDDYLTKPFMPEILFEKVSRYYKPVA